MIEYVIWTEEMIEKEVVRISNCYLDGKTMPSCSVLFEVTGNHSLSNAIYKWIGLAGLAKKLDLKMAESTYNLSMVGTLNVKKIVESMGFEASLGKLKDNHSLLINGSNKLYISCSNPVNKKGYRIHKFKTKSTTNNDINVFCAFDEDGDIENYFIVPHTVFNKTNCTIDIGKRGKYYKFQDWNLLYNVTSN